MRKLDWMTFAIGAPDLFVCDRCLDASLPSDAGLNFRVQRTGMRVCPAWDLPAAVDLSRKLERVKQKARRRGIGSLVGGKDCANDSAAASRARRKPLGKAGAAAGTRASASEALFPALSPEARG